MGCTHFFYLRCQKTPSPKSAGQPLAFWFEHAEGRLETVSTVCRRATSLYCPPKWEDYLRPIPREFRVKHVSLPEGQIERVQSGRVLVRRYPRSPMDTCAVLVRSTIRVYGCRIPTHCNRRWRASFTANGPADTQPIQRQGNYGVKKYRVR